MLLQEITGKKIAVNCLTREECERIVNMFDTDNWKKKSLMGGHDTYGEDVCYENYDGNQCYAPADFFKEHGFEVIPSTDIVNP